MKINGSYAKPRKGGPILIGFAKDSWSEVMEEFKKKKVELIHSFFGET